MAKELQMPLGVVSYHLNRVLDSECEVLEMVAKVRRRGTWEYTYTINAKSFTGVFPWDEFPESIQTHLRSFSFSEFLALAIASMTNGSVGSLNESKFEWTPAEVDRRGWGEICDAADQFGEGVETAIAKSRRRGHRNATPGDPLKVVVGLATFEAAPPVLKSE